MKILQVSTASLSTPPTFGGAIESYVFRLAVVLNRAGHDVHLIGVRNTSASYNGLVLHDIHLAKGSMAMRSLHLPQGSFSLTQSASAALETSRVISSLGTDYDVVHCHFLDTAMGYLFARKSSMGAAKSFVHLHNVPVVTLANRPVLWGFYRSFDGVLAVSNYVRERFLERIRCEPRKVIVIPNAVDTTEFSAKGNSEASSDSEQAVNLLYVGRVIRTKGLHEVIRALGLLKREGRLNRIVLVVVGPAGDFNSATADPYMLQVKELCRELELDDRVRFVGQVERWKLVELYRNADMVIVPSNWGDPSPLVVLEAMACGKPVIAFRDGGIPELIDDKKTGLLVARGDFRALASAIDTLSSTPEFRASLGASAALRARNDFSFEVLARRLISTYESF